MTTVKQYISILLITGKAFFDTLIIKNRKSKVMIARQKYEALKRWEEEGGNLGLPQTGEKL